MDHKELGLAVVGSGRIGTLRASMAAAHPAVRFLAVSDLDPSRAHALADKVGAQLSSGDNLEVISRPEVNAVIVSTPENEHVLPVLQALELERPVLVEKPIAMSLEDADRILAGAAEAGVELRVGYSMRFKRRYLLAKEQILRGRLGQIVGGTGRVYNSRAQAFEILKRSPNATPVVDVLTYYVGMFCWWLEGNPPVEVVARGQTGIFKAAGYSAHDVTWAILTFADGAVVSLGVDYALPEKYPTLGQSVRLEILGTEGVMLFDTDYKDQILYTDRGIPRSYVPGLGVNMAFLSSSSSGDWALGDFWGPLANETRAWLDHLSTGRSCALATPEEARETLEVTLAIERSVQSKEAVRLSPGGGG
jgi:predicted dehydrogenase